MSGAANEFAELLAEYRRHASSDRIGARRAALRYRALARRRGDAVRDAEGALLLAEVEAGAGRLRVALARFEEAVGGFERAGDARRALAARIGRVQTLAALGDGGAVRREIRSLRAAATEPVTRAYGDPAGRHPNRNPAG